MKLTPFLLIAAGLTCLGTNLPSAAQSVEKVADLNFQSFDGIGYGGYAPLDRFTQVDTNLWYTTKRGGTFDAGTISRFDLVTHEVVEVASLDNNSGKAPESPLLVIGDEAYFTTVNGGAGNRGTIAKIGLTNGTVSALYHFPADGSFGATPRAGLTRIGDELWTLTSLGGISNRGVIVKFNLTNYAVTVVTNLDGRTLGTQPFGGFTPAGSNAWFFTTFSGGDSTFKTTNYHEILQSDGSTAIITNSLPLGAGTLGRLTFDGEGNPVATTLVELPAGYTQFPGVEPCAVGSNILYFGSIGPNSLPGAIQSYDLVSGLFSNLFNFPTNADSALAIGTRPGYSGLVEWLGDLYFINRSGGTSNAGVVAKFNIASNTVTKLADLEGTGSQSLGSASGFFGTGTIVEVTNRFYLYYPLTDGGANDRGTIIRVALPPPPIEASLARTDEPAELALSWIGGYPPFTVQASSDITVSGWTNLAVGVTNRDLAVPADSPRCFFRIAGDE